MGASPLRPRRHLTFFLGNHSPFEPSPAHGKNNLFFQSHRENEGGLPPSSSSRNSVRSCKCDSFFSFSLCFPPAFLKLSPLNAVPAFPESEAILIFLFLKLRLSPPSPELHDGSRTQPKRDAGTTCQRDTCVATVSAIVPMRLLGHRWQLPLFFFLWQNYTRPPRPRPSGAVDLFEPPIFTTTHKRSMFSSRLTKALGRAFFVLCAMFFPSFSLSSPGRNFSQFKLSGFASPKGAGPPYLPLIPAP